MAKYCYLDYGPDGNIVCTVIHRDNRNCELYPRDDQFNTDHLECLMMHISKECRKFALKHNRSMLRLGSSDNGVWVARGFVAERYISRSGLSNSVELSVIGDTLTEAAEKFLTLLTEYKERRLDANKQLKGAV